MTSLADHWNRVYASKAPDAVSWYRPRLDSSLALLDALGCPSDTRVIDVGCGASSLIADLLRRGYLHLTALDISERAVAIARGSLADAARDTVRWMVTDILEADLAEASVDLWHDRATFHFLTSPGDRARYASLARRAIAPGGHILLGGFASDGPMRCSDLEVVRASPEDLHAALGEGFRWVTGTHETHVTPWGASQRFAYCVSRRIA